MKPCERVTSSFVSWLSNDGGYLSGFIYFKKRFALPHRITPHTETKKNPNRSPELLMLQKHSNLCSYCWPARWTNQIRSLCISALEITNAVDVHAIGYDTEAAQTESWNVFSGISKLGSSFEETYLHCSSSFIWHNWVYLKFRWRWVH